MNHEAIANRYRELYGGEPLLVKSAGRVNLIGEHVDYNDGFVLPAAVDKAIYVAIGKRSDDQFNWHAYNLEHSFEGNAKHVQPVEHNWPNYILGVVAQLQRAGFEVGGFNLVIGGDVPTGAGMSSSAAVECATAFGLNELFAFGIDKMTMVKMAQKAEHEFAGVMCGIMDQFASMMGKKGHVIKLDCRSLDYEYVPFDFDGIDIVLFDSKVKHSLASTEYNTRRQECEAGVSLIKQQYPHIKNLRDVTIEMVEQVLPGTFKVYDRCKFVVEEIARLQAACEDLKAGSLEAFGQKMYATHEGLSKLYEVSCPELDFLAEAAKSEPAILGARMMGGGFGGCTINLVKHDEVDGVIERMTGLFEKQYGIKPGVYKSVIDDGAVRLN